MTSEIRETGRPIIDWFDEPYVLRDVDGDKVGDIVEVNPDFIVVETDGGFLGLGEHRRYFIPRNQVSGEEGGDWRVSVDKDQLESMNWSNAPTSSHFATEDWRQLYGYGEGDAAAASGVALGGEAGTTAGGRMRLIRFEEDLQAQKVQRQAGEVSVRKEVVEEIETIEVPVRREEVRVERRPVTDATAAYEADTAFRETEDEIRVPVMQEEVEVRKVARPVEEVVVSKEAHEETRRVSDTVRREQFDIQGDEGLTATPEDEQIRQVR